jgi:putative transposase
MPWGLQRFQETGQLHFLTFSCYMRPNFTNAPARITFEASLEQVRRRCGLCVYGYVVMPEHVHMLVNEPEQNLLSSVMQSLKQSVARTLALRARDPFWQARYYDFNVWSQRKFVEKLRYIHRNPARNSHRSGYLKPEVGVGCCFSAGLARYDPSLPLLLLD